MGAQLFSSHGSGPAAGLLLLQKSLSGGTSMPGPPSFIPSQRRGRTTLLQHGGLLSCWQQLQPRDPSGSPYEGTPPLFFISQLVFWSRAAVCTGLIPLGGCLPRWDPRASPAGCCGATALGTRSPPSRAPRCANGIRPWSCVPRAPARCQGHASGMRPRHGSGLCVARPREGCGLTGREERGCWQHRGSPDGDSTMPWIANGAEMRDCGNNQFPVGRRNAAAPAGSRALGRSCQEEPQPELAAAGAGRRKAVPVPRGREGPGERWQPS